MLDRGEVGAIEVLRATIENQISTWLSQLAWVGGEVEVDVLVPCQPQIPLRLVGLEVAADSGATADGLRLGSTKGDAPVSDEGVGQPVEFSAGRQLMPDPRLSPPPRAPGASAPRAVGCLDLWPVMITSGNARWPAWRQNSWRRAREEARCLSSR